jgi:spore maturation protein CgeB
MKILFIGHYEQGSTSKMRGEYLQQILIPEEFRIADIDIPLKATSRFFRSIGWRLKLGPLIKNIREHVIKVLDNKWDYDLVWVEKGVFIDPSLVRKLAKHSKKLVHFTPDPAFTYHRSKLFYEALPFYDHCVTTKSFEKEYYEKAGAKQLISCTQGFDPMLHKPYHDFQEKRGIVFIGHHEKDREEMIAGLLKRKLPVTIAGINWEGFAKRNKKDPNLIYMGTGLFGIDYARTISAATIGLGLLSKIIPELHTTRTIEIPACGTALVTERTNETSAIFADNDAIFFTGNEELFEKIENILADPGRLRTVTANGMDKVQNGGYDYRSIVLNILKQVFPPGSIKLNN